MPVTPKPFTQDDSTLVVVDIQSLFRSLIHDMDLVLANSSRLARFFQTLKMPVVVTEHYSSKLGGTVEDLAAQITPWEPIEKITFSCAGNEDFLNRLQETGRRQVILCGIETHVCVYQTARDLLNKNYQVALAADAVSSRLALNRELGIDAMRDLGVQIMSTEMLMFEILKVALTDDFRAVSDILKENPKPVDLS
jgi:nicotinamidase-related amidase